MTQFASKLYPQANPTNQVLLEVRSSMRPPASLSAKCGDWIRFLRSPYSGQFYRADQAEHALRVVERLASISG